MTDMDRATFKAWRKERPVIGLIAAAALASGCATTRDQTAFVTHMPRSILVLPPLNGTPEVLAPDLYLTTVTRPLAERGYYVFPVGVVEALMRDNGCPTPAEMHQVPLEKLREIFQPDAVLYLTLEDWGARYQIVESVTRVTVRGVLVDARTGARLWEGRESAEDRSGVSQQPGPWNALITLIGAAAHQIASDDESSRWLAVQANRKLFSSSDGVLPGPYDPDHAKALKEARERLGLPPPQGTAPSNACTSRCEDRKDDIADLRPK